MVEAQRPPQGQPSTARVPGAQPGSPELRSCPAAVPGGRDGGGRCSAPLQHCSPKASCHFPSSSPAKSFLTSRLKLKVPDYRCGQEKLFRKHTPPQNKIPVRSTLLTLPRPAHLPGGPGSFLRCSRCGSALTGMASATGTPRFLLPTCPAGEEPPAPAPSTCQG